MADRKTADRVSVKSGSGSAKFAPGRAGALAWKQGYLPDSRSSAFAMVGATP